MDPYYESDTSKNTQTSSHSADAEEQWELIVNNRMFMDQFRIENGDSTRVQTNIDHLTQRRFTSMGSWVPDSDPVAVNHNLDSPITPYTQPIPNLVVDTPNPRLDERFLLNRRNELENTFGTYSVIDGGSECTTLGAGHSLQQVQPFSNVRMGGPSSSLGSVQMFKCTGFTRVMSSEGPIILRTPNCIAYSDEMRTSHKESLICNAQVRANNVLIDDVPQRYNGASCIVIYEEGRQIVIPLQYSCGLTILPHQLPTEPEILELETYDLTSDD